MTQSMPTALAFFNFSGWELAIILVFGLLIWGKNLPGLGRSVGKTIVEFKKGLADIPTDVTQSQQPPAQGSYSPQQSLPGASAPQQPQSNPQSQYQRPA